ncbi:hypothetical protein BJY01DRAFT_213772, partial [Aspergillus pseudoustus]
MSTSTDEIERSACDACYKRKIKCDRREQCENCLQGRIKCQRKRAKPTRQKRYSSSRISSLEDKLAKLEQSATVLSRAKWSSQPSVRDGSPCTVGRTDIRPYVNFDALQNGGTALKFCTPDGLNQQTSYARTFLQQEIEAGEMLADDRSAVLKAAATLVDQISNTANIPRGADYQNPPEVDGSLISRDFPKELVYLVIIGSESSSSSRLYWPDHISATTFEHMCLLLEEKTLDEQTLHHYRVCIYAKAIFFVSRLPAAQYSERLRRHLQDSKKQYEAIILTSLSKIQILTSPPSLSLLQALLSGALIMQLRGDMFRAWTLISIASRTLVALNFHTIGSASQCTETEKQIRAAVLSCYYLDKILSVLLLRPPSLPRLKAEPTDLVALDPHIPLSAILKAMVEFAQIQEVVLDILFESGRSDERQQSAIIDVLIQKMYSIREQLDEQRSRPDFGVVEYEWTAIDFSYYAILSNILLLNQRLARAPIARQESVAAARRSLTSLRRMQDTVTADFLDEYPYYLTWTMLLFPLSPFFILFCHVVYTSDAADYSLMTAVTSGLSRFAESNASIGKLHKLFSTFLALCDGLVVPHRQVTVRQSPTVPENCSSYYATGSSQAQADDGIPDTTSIGQADVGAPFQDPVLPGPSTGQMADNNFVWELLYSQPWLGWTEADCLYEPT